ncbi:acetyl-CoA carboxylase biotin carboxyl carrier protein [Endomicrobium proavitum]|uniref:Biotin carboxyl carrier protein of acetyl-CoA carboxylase n=1 Tax=Endomicrobium proavitum TaxID=1408281 RepID=A0A0G3WJS3_9BACT|nr:biotin/lipoyl-containing protein [Endomicrobium proavitum]AKL98538.1 Biotin carboxyl carrier protein of acetyl-CoA carboxylase [Endomicrobium proavitum]
MNPQEIKAFLKSVKETDIEELEYQSGEDSLYFKKSAAEFDAAPAAQAAAEQVVAEEEKSSIVAITSATVGTFHAAGSDKSQVIKEGSSVEPGKKVGQIEAMKIIKDVVSKVKGKVVKVSVANGASVEYGQELFLVDTSK